jgi:hypothetical protein
MVVVRYTWHYQSSRFGKAQQLVQEANVPEASALRGWRAYRSRTGTTNTVALEWEFESLADWEAFAAQFFALPANADYFRKWMEVEPSSGTCEVWDVIARG